MDFQVILVVVIIAAAVIYLGRSIYRSSRGHACESGNCKCETKSLKKV